MTPTEQDKGLFELCKQVYEATGWAADMDKGVDYVWCHETLTRLPIDWDTSDFHQHIPLYTSDYLLEKLPYKIGEANSAIWLRLGKTRNSFTVCYMGSDLVCLYDFEADTPLKSLLKLTIALHEEGLV